MLSERFAVVRLLAFIVAGLVAGGAAAEAARGFAITVAGGRMPLPPTFRSAVATAAQDPPAAEAALALARPARRVIQQGLRNEGFDPGSPDGLFGTRTRAAIRAWQAARGHAETGYLDGVQAKALRDAGVSRAAASGAATDIPPARRGRGGRSDPGAGTLRRVEWVECVRSLRHGDCRGGDRMPGCGGLGRGRWRRQVDASCTSRRGGTRIPRWSKRSSPLAPISLLQAKTVVRRPCTPRRGGNENPAVVEALLAAGADIAAGDNDGEMPLHHAARWNDAAVVEALLAAGADIAAGDNDGETPLHHAARWNDAAVVEALLAAGADIAAGDNDGETPLHHAARWNDAAVVEALLAAGADIAAGDNDGETPPASRGEVERRRGGRSAPRHWRRFRGTERRRPYALEPCHSERRPCRA